MGCSTWRKFCGNRALKTAAFVSGCIWDVQVLLKSSGFLMLMSSPLQYTCLYLCPGHPIFHPSSSLSSPGLFCLQTSYPNSSQTGKAGILVGENKEDWGQESQVIN
jgi:hypothetical protein